MVFLAAALQRDRTYNLGALIAFRLGTNRDKGGICGGLIASRLLAMHGVEPHSLDVQLSIEKLDIVSMIKHDFVSNWSNLNNLSYEITFFKKKWRVIKSERLVRLPAPALFNLDSRKSWSVTEDELDAYIERCDHHAGNGGSLIFERDLEALAEFLERPHPEFFGGQVNDQPGGELQWVVVADLRGKLEPPMSERIQFSVRENNRVDGLARAMQEALARLCGQNVNKINGNRTIPNATFGNISEEDSEGDTRNAGEFSKNSLSREEVEEVVRLGDKLKEASAWVRDDELAVCSDVEKIIGGFNLPKDISSSLGEALKLAFLSKNTEARNKLQAIQVSVAKYCTLVQLSRK